jgi:glycosyltransferase involved in cell wall biosynthesis
LHLKILGIDAMNIRDGGGLTHLREIISNIHDTSLLFDQVIVWGNQSCLDALPNRSWLIKIQPLRENAGIIKTTLWQVFQLSSAAEKMGCSILFIAGGSSFTSFKPYVTICHNMLPFTENALELYGVRSRRLKFQLLRFIQLQTFRRAKGVIFLSNWAMQHLRSLMAKSDLLYTVIPHGINSGFHITNRVHRNIADCSQEQPFTIIYISRIEPYKKQLEVIQCLNKVRLNTGWPIRLVLAGLASDHSYLQEMHQLIQKSSRDENWISYMGPVPYENLREIYTSADLAVFASTCENMPIILLEKMAAGLPIVCSNVAPMPDFLEGAGLLVDIEDETDFSIKLQSLIQNREYRTKLSQIAQINAVKYQWSKTAKETFQFLFSSQ